MTPEMPHAPPQAPFRADGDNVRDRLDVPVLGVDPLGFYMPPAEREAFAVKVAAALNAQAGS